MSGKKRGRMVGPLYHLSKK